MGMVIAGIQHERRYVGEDESDSGGPVGGETDPPVGENGESDDCEDDDYPRLWFSEPVPGEPGRQETGCYKKPADDPDRRVAEGGKPRVGVEYLLWRCSV